MAKMITKVIKCKLDYLGGCSSFSDMQKQLWLLQRYTQELMNKTVQLYVANEIVPLDGAKLPGKNLSRVQMEKYTENCP